MNEGLSVTNLSSSACSFKLSEARVFGRLLTDGVGRLFTLNPIHRLVETAQTTKKGIVTGASPPANSKGSKTRHVTTIASDKTDRTIQDTIGIFSNRSNMALRKSVMPPYRHLAGECELGGVLVGGIRPLSGGWPLPHPKHRIEKLLCFTDRHAEYKKTEQNCDEF